MIQFDHYFHFGGSSTKSLKNRSKNHGPGPVNASGPSPYIRTKPPFGMRIYQKLCQDEMRQQAASLFSRLGFPQEM